MSRLKTALWIAGGLVAFLFGMWWVGGKPVESSLPPPERASSPAKPPTERIPP